MGWRKGGGGGGGGGSGEENMYLKAQGGRGEEEERWKPFMTDAELLSNGVKRGRGGRLGEVWRYFNNIPQSRRGGDSTQERTERKRGGEVELIYDEPREEDN